jgi:hypothetical protein
MSCNCKKPSNELSSNDIKSNGGYKVLNTIINFITFLIVLTITIPFVIPLLGYLLFKSIVLKDSTINTFNLFYLIGKKLIKDDGDDGEDLDNEEYELELEDLELVNLNDK